MPAIKANTPGHVQNILSPITQSELSVFEVKSLKNLTHGSFGLFNSATPDNPKAVGELGATAVFYKSKMLQLSNYSYETSGSQPQMIARELASKVDRDERLQYASVEIELTDIAALGMTTREQFLGYVLGSFGIVQTAFFDALYIQAAIDAVTRTGAGSYQVVEIPKLSNLATPEERLNAYFKIVDAKIDIARQLSRYNLGSNPADYGLILHAHIWPRLKSVINAYSGSVGAEVRYDQITGFEQITNFGNVKDHIFLNKNIPAGADGTISKDIAFNFTNYWGVLAHKESLFVAIQGHTMVQRPNRRGNNEVIRKFGFYKGYVRPELVVVFKEGGTFTPTPQTVQVVSSTTDPVFNKVVTARK